QELLAFKGEVNSTLAFSPDGHQLAIASPPDVFVAGTSAAFDGTVRILDAAPVPPQPPQPLPAMPPPAKALVRPLTEGWHLSDVVATSGSFDVGLDSKVHHGGQRSAGIKSSAAENTMTGGPGVRQIFRADEYRGKRVRLSAFLKTDRAEGQGGHLV